MKRNKQFDEILAKVPEETKRIVEKQMTCKWLRNGNECGKGLPGTLCEVKGCVAWEHYDPADAMKALDKKIKKVSEAGTWDRVDVDKYMDKIRGKDNNLIQAARELVEAVKGYVCPQKGDKYVFRGEVLRKCNELKRLLDEAV